MPSIILNPSQIVTVNSDGKNYKRGKDLKDIGIIENHSIIIEDNTVQDIIPNESINIKKYDKIIDATDKVILPGFVECHTHTLFSGSRANEFRQKLLGVSYEEIAKNGGGINSTVNSVRNSSFSELVNLVIPRIQNFIAQGVTTLEIKSGYGLDFENEIKMLNIIKYLNNIFTIDIIPTFLGAHTFPNEFSTNREGYLDLIIDRMLPYIANEKLANACDIFCEETAFAVDDVDKIFNRAKEFNIPLRMHTDQFNSIGGIGIAVKNNVDSVDHLEVINDDDILNISETETVCVLLPGVSYFLNHIFAPANKLIDNNAIVALATDFNPGSSNISNISFILNLAVLKMKMKIEESISAYTLNSAKVLRISNKIGSIEIGKRADFSILDTDNYVDLIYNVGKNLNCKTIKNGQVVFEQNGGKF